MKRLLFVLIQLLFLFTQVYSQSDDIHFSGKDKVESKNFSRFFDNFSGCMIIYDNGNKKYIVYNQEKCLTRVSPCSTFKVINSLIGLQEGVVSDEKTVFKWNGTEYPLEAWNHDLSMEEAIKLSAFWYYQIIAKKVGEKRMQFYVDKIGYGNKDISGGITQFWQQSTLKISPKEQVDILRNIYEYNVPFDRRNINILKKIMRLEAKNNKTLYGKTGSGLSSPGFQFQPGDQNVNGWFIGFVEMNNVVYYFATNIGAKKDATGQKAKNITVAVLNNLNIY
jgi:beta-lactamase class D